MTVKQLKIGGSVVAILIAIIQFGPNWKSVFENSFISFSSTDKKLSFYVVNVILEEIEKPINGRSNVIAYYNVK